MNNVSCDNYTVGNELQNVKLVNSSAESSTTQVYAMAEMSYSKTSTVTQDDVRSLLGILKGKDHLKRNFGQVSRYDYCKTVVDEHGIFTHCLPIVLDIDVSHLWENPRSYIYHHLGRDSWTLSNGTTIKLSRIHRK